MKIIPRKLSERETQAFKLGYRVALFGAERKRATKGKYEDEQHIKNSHELTFIRGPEVFVESTENLASRRMRKKRIPVALLRSIF